MRRRCVLLLGATLVGVSCRTGSGASSEPSGPEGGLGQTGNGGERPAGSGGESAGGARASEAGAGAGGLAKGGAGAPGGSNAAGGGPGVAGGGGQTLVAGASGETGQAGSAESSGESVWSPLSVLTVVNPRDHGAVGDGVVDDLSALSATVDALPAAGGVVYLPEGASFKKTNLLTIGKAHVKFWAPNRQAEVFQSIAGQKRHQSMLCRSDGCGFFGVKFRSDAVARFDALEDNQISADHGSLVEVAGCEIQGSAAAGIFLYGSSEHYLEGNYVHHTWADHIHHTEGAKESWVWGNFILNDDPSKGDDGVACVTYGPASPRCRDMEWWNNTILHTGWGRGYAVIGGDNIAIHHNWAIGVAGAGIIVASEPSYDSASSNGVTITSNYVYQCGHTIAHPGILLSGMNGAAEPLNAIVLSNNVSADNASGAYRSEGALTNVSNVGLSTAAAVLPRPIPTSANIKLADTSILRTRDVSYVSAGARSGLYRIQLRRAPSGSGFQERFEYVVKGSKSAMTAFVQARLAAGDYLSEQRTVVSSEYALLLASAPLTIPSAISPVTFAEMRAADSTGELSWLWQRVDSGNY